MKSLWVLCLAFVLTQGQLRSFTVDYTGDTFLKDGKPFTFASGELHYFRVPKINWKDRMQKIKLLGFNAVSTLVEWSLHEPQPGQFNFQDDADLVSFVKLAQSLDLNVILRPGPFIEAQRDFGGLPAWILMEKSEMRIRSPDATFKFLVEKWYNKLFEEITPLLYGNGGPIIMVQIENDYGGYIFNDPSYLQWLVDLTESYVQNAAVLFTSDTEAGLTRGRTPNVLATIRFGPGQNVTAMAEDIRSWQPHGPLVNSEYTTAEVSYWGGNVVLNNASYVADGIKRMLDNKFNFNCYMIAGGTNYGFTAGNDGGNDSIAITSYYNDAPITEAGDLTDKYMAIWELMTQYHWPTGSKDAIDKLRAAPKGSYGEAILGPVISLLKSPIGKPITTPSPLTMETFHQNGGFIAYSHVVRTHLKKISQLHGQTRDRAIVLVNGNIVDTTESDDWFIAIPPQTAPTANITILVENLGRKDYQWITDASKGLLSDVTLDGVVLKNWQTVSYTFTADDMERIQSLPPPKSDADVQLPAFFLGTLLAPYPYDTYLDMSGWGKGVAFVNGHNLGRYWSIGPQHTLYVPATYLYAYPGVNIITVMELHAPPTDKTVRFIPEPKFDL